MLATAMLICSLTFAQDPQPEARPEPPPQGQRAKRAQRQRGDRPPPIELDALTQEQAWELAQVQATLPDPNVAMNQSLIVGFGSGHFYAKQPMPGFIHAGVQLVGVAVAAAGMAKKFSLPSGSNAYEEAQTLQFIGLGIAGAGRLADAYTAPFSARRTADEALAFSR